MHLADRRKAVVVAVGSLLVTAALVALVLSLGAWAYHTRRYLLHEGRLARLLEEHPTANDVSTALLSEPGNWAIAVPPSEEELAALTGQWSRGQVEEILAKRRMARELRIFGVRDMVYVLFFDAEGRLQAYVLMSNQRFGSRLSGGRGRRGGAVDPAAGAPGWTAYPSRDG